MLQGIPREFRCPLTTLPFHNPVLTSDGFTFERSAIEEWFSKGNSTNPITFSPLPSLQLHQNSILKSVMGKYKDFIDRVQGLQIKCEALSKTVYGLEVENKVLRGMVEQHQLQNRQPIHIEAPTELIMCEKYYDSAASALSILPYRCQLQSATITIQSTLPPTQPYLPHNPGYSPHNPGVPTTPITQSTTTPTNPGVPNLNYHRVPIIHNLSCTYRYIWQYV